MVIFFESFAGRFENCLCFVVEMPQSSMKALVPEDAKKEQQTRWV
jgi:hypothetical protein